MITKPIKFMQICATADHIFGLSEAGEVYYRDKPPYFSGTNQATYYAGAAKKDTDEDKKVWKKLFMGYRYDVPKGGPEREAQAGEIEPPTEPADVVVDEPAQKVYKDIETVKRVQQALKDKGIYKENYKVDGDLGNLTQTAIKTFQKSVNLRETGEITLTLCNALGLNTIPENETVVEGNAELIENVEDDNEVFVGA